MEPPDEGVSKAAPPNPWRAPGGHHASPWDENFTVVEPSFSPWDGNFTVVEPSFKRTLESKRGDLSPLGV